MLKYCFSLNILYTHFYTSEARLEQHLSSEKMELATRVQIQDKAVCVSFRTNALEKRMNLSILSIKQWVNSWVDLTL